MKTFKLLAVTFIALAFSFNGNLMAQPGGNEHQMGEYKMFMNKEHSGDRFGMMIPNLTDEQKSKIKDLKIAHFKEVQPLRNKLGELRARERTLTTADKPDMKAINANIDEITNVQNQLMKARESHRQQIRALLNDEQRIYFDMHGMQMMRNRGKALMSQCEGDKCCGNPFMHHEQ